MADDKQANGAFDKELAELLHSVEEPSSYQFSPNADKIVYQSGIDFIKGKNGVSTLWLATTEAGSARKLTTGRFSDSSPQWHPDGERIAFLSDRVKPGTSAIWMMPLSGGDAQPISSLDSKQSIGSFKLSPDGQKIAFMAEDEPKKDDDDESVAQVWGEKWDHTRLFILDVESGEAKAVSPDDRNVASLSWHPDSKSVAYQSVENTDEGEDGITGTQIDMYELDTGSSRNVCTVKSEVYRLTCMADGKVYFIAPYELHLLKASRGVYAVDSNAPGARIARQAFFGETDTPGDLQIAGGKLYVSRLEGVGKVISDLAGNDVFRTERPLGPWKIAIDPKSQEPVLAGTLSDPSNPWEAFFLRRGHEEVKLSSLGDKALGKVNAAAHVFTCRSMDDQEDITGIFIAPNAPGGDARKPLPTLVMPHGGPTYNDLPTFDPNLLRWTPYLLSKGYAILLPQYRGSTGYGQRFAAWSGKGIGSFDYEDVISVTDHAVKAGFADPKRLMVGYWSQGGYLSYLCAVRNGLHELGWKFNAAIAGAGFVDIDGLILGSDTGMTDQLELAAFKAPWALGKDDTTSRKGSAIWEMKHAVDEAKRRGEMVIPPVLIMHGDQDIRTPYWQAVAFRKAMRFYGLPCEFVTYPGAAHLPMMVKQQLDMLDRVARWCDKYIGVASGDESTTKTQMT